MPHRVALPLQLAALLPLASCFPGLDDRPWLVEETRVLAVRAVPAEQLPSQPVELQALVASPTGTVLEPLRWSVCTVPRAATERAGVTASCLDGTDLSPVDTDMIVLADACARFGPNPPPTSGDELPRRPADPDPTGGYYLPVRAATSDMATAFGFLRIRCDLAGATREIFEQYQDRYVRNVNPEIAAVTARAAGASPAPADGTTVRPGAELILRLEAAPAAAEDYVIYSAEASALFDRTEALSLSWFVSAGELDRASDFVTGEQAAGGATFEATWKAPDAAMEASGWAVLRDERGGQAWTEFSISVQPTE